MPFPRPTLTDLRAQVATDITSGLPGAEALLRYSNLRVLATGQAGLAHGHYGYLDFIARQAVPFTATDEYLEGWAALKDVIRKPATPAIGTARFTAADGTSIPSGVALTRSDGVTFVTTAQAQVASGVISVAIAATDTGSIGNADSGAAIALAVAIPGVASSGVLYGPTTGGADVEDDDALRSRMLLAYSSPAQGGSAADFEQWSLDVPGVTRAWVRPDGMGPGTVLVYFMLDDAQAAHAGFPQGTNGVAAAETRDIVATGDQLALANELYVKAPTPILVYAVAPLTNLLTITIRGLSDASATTQAAVATAIRAALVRSGTPGGSTALSAIEGAIANVTSAAGFVITSIACTAGSIDPSPVGNIISNAGALPALNAIVWT